MRLDVSSVISADGAAATVPTAGSLRFYGALLYSTGNNAVDAVIYDNTAASGRVVAAGRSQDGSAVWIGPPQDCWVDCPLGLFVDVTGTAPRVIVYYLQS